MPPVSFRQPFPHGIYLVTDKSLCIYNPLLEVVSKALQAGICCVQYRDKTQEDLEFYQEAKQLLELCQTQGTAFVVNDRVDVFLKLQREFPQAPLGLHLGQSDLDPKTARTLVGPKPWIGLSVETRDQVNSANELFEQGILDSLGVSPIFSTPTKTDTKSIWGLEGLLWVSQKTNAPLTAIGGLKKEHIAMVRTNGASQLAVVSAICSAKDPFNATKELVDLWECPNLP